MSCLALAALDDAPEFAAGLARRGHGAVGRGLRGCAADAAQGRVKPDDVAAGWA
jgi:hypothetical protein